MPIRWSDFDYSVMKSLFPNVWEQRTNPLPVPIKEKVSDLKEPEASPPELFSLQEQEASSPIDGDGVGNADPIQAGHEGMTLNFSKCQSGGEGSTVVISDGTTASEGGRNTVTNGYRTSLPKMTPEEMTVTNSYSQSGEGKPATAEPRAGVPSQQETDGGTTLYHNPHRVRRTGNRLEIQSPEPLPRGQHPRNFDELLDFLAECAITVKSTTEGLVFTGGTEGQRQRVADCLNACVWTYGNLRHYLDGTLRDIDGRKYVHPKDRFC